MSAESLLSHLSVIRDPRIDRHKKHDLHAMLFVSVCAVMSGAEGWSDIVEFAESKQDWLKGFVDLDNGIPVDDTFARVLSRIPPRALEEAFTAWARSLAGETGEAAVVAIDGKTARRSHDRRRGRHPFHGVRAWATEAGMALGQVATETKSNEITALPDLLAQLELRGALVTLDAMGCQRAVADQVIEQGGDYVLAVKGNQPGLQEALADFFETADSETIPRDSAHYYEQVEQGHGRVETRRCWASDCLATLPDAEQWRGLQSIVLVESERDVDGTVSRERRYFISSRPPEARTLAGAIRAHWEVENALHWVLDVTFREDDSRIRRGHGAQNFSTLRQFALNLLKNEATNISVRKKRVRCALNDKFRSQVLASATI
ncbi:MAG: ISAs1 family transposase [Thiohalospira sp.]